MYQIKPNTKLKILSTAGRLFAQKGYYGVSMQDVADELKITKAALYYHFRSKEELTRELLQEAIVELKDQLRQAVEKSRFPDDLLFNLAKTLLDFQASHPEVNLLNSMGIVPDDKVPILQFVTDLRLELVRFIRELIGGVDFIRKGTYRSIFTMATTLISFTLSPFNYNQKATKRMAADLTALLTQKLD